ncbi:MAG TPA: methyltransferase domain-containing protein [Bdellovibrionota bacterium]|jgi:SAM-dependent methyltransferase
MQIESTGKLGAYAKKQLLGTNFFLGWSHGARFRYALRLVEGFSPGSVLDYGCGDGTFLYLLGGKVSQRIGFDSDLKQVADCRTRLGSEIRFLDLSGIDDPALEGTFELITCMEVIEHCLPEQRHELLRRVQRLLKPGGRIVFSVPVEIGPALVGKQLVRAFLALTKVGHYEHREKYTVGELLKMLFAGARTKITRPVYETVLPGGQKIAWHGHKGFNWREFGLELHEEFVPESRAFTPLSFTGGLCSSQAWFVCRKKNP